MTSYWLFLSARDHHIINVVCTLSPSRPTTTRPPDVLNPRPPHTHGHTRCIVPSDDVTYDVKSIRRRLPAKNNPSMVGAAVGLSYSSSR